MRVIVISCEPYLSNFLQIANKNLDIAVILTPIMTMQKNIKLNFINGKSYNVRPYAFLKESLVEYYYEYIIVAIPDVSLKKIVLDDLEKLKINKKIIFGIGSIYTGECHLRRFIFNYMKRNIEKYKILITGLSYAHTGTEATIFDLPVLKCTMTSQDLYYDYLFAKRILEIKNSAFKYAIIGLSPYSFHYDESRSTASGQGGGWLDLDVLSRF